MTPTWKLWSALGAVYLIWGSTYLGIKIAVEDLPPLLTAGSRFLAAGLVLATVLLALGHSVRVTPREAVSAAAMGLLMLAFGVGLVHVAETRIDSSVAAMIAGSVPLQVVVWRIAAGERVSRTTRIAAAVGLGGLALVVLPGFAGSSSAVGLAVMVLASMSWSAGSFLSLRVRMPRDPFVASTIEMGAAGAALCVAGLVAGEGGELTAAAFTPEAVAAWVYLAIAGSVIGFSAYVWLLGRAPISQVVTHQYVNPLVAIALGSLLLGEQIPLTTALGAAVVLGAVFATVRVESIAQRRRARRAEPAVDSAA